MPYIYAQVANLEGTAKVGNKQCVALLQHYAKLPPTIAWKQGKLVLGDKTILPGTAIATLTEGSYRNAATGNHAAFFVSQDAGGIWIMDQWYSDEKKPQVSKRYIRKRGQWKDGSFIDPSNNADAYSVIE